MTKRERLIELISHCRGRKTGEEVADYLLENGVEVLPCKLGDTLYDISEFIFGDDAEAEMYELKADEITVCKDYFIIDSCEVGFGDIGKTVFLTREEAEKALKKGE